MGKKMNYKEEKVLDKMLEKLIEKIKNTSWNKYINPRSIQYLEHDVSTWTEYLVKPSELIVFYIANIIYDGKKEKCIITSIRNANGSIKSLVNEIPNYQCVKGRSDIILDDIYITKSGLKKYQNLQKHLQNKSRVQWKLDIS